MAGGRAISKAADRAITPIQKDYSCILLEFLGTLTWTVASGAKI